MTKTHASYAQSGIFWVNFWGTLCHLIFLESNVIGERKKHKAQVELLQLRIPPNPKKTECPEKKNYDKVAKETLIHCLYSEILI